MKNISIQTQSEKQFLDISDELQNLTSEHGWKNGILTAYIPHTTAAVTINENADPDVPRDILTHLQKLVPREAGYHHAEGNSDAHILSSLIGNTVQVIVENGKLQLGTWQSVFFCEFDGPRSRKVWVEFSEREREKGKRQKKE